jgi:hypothetical protein
LNGLIYVWIFAPQELRNRVVFQFHAPNVKSAISERPFWHLPHL